MNLAALYSGGKDSTFAIYKALQHNHEVSCLITMLPAKPDSLFFHYPNAFLTTYQAECMGMPLISTKVQCRGQEEELLSLEQALREAKETFAIDGIVSGGLSSRFQQKGFQNIAEKLSLQYYSPNWNVDQVQYMHELLKNNFSIMIVGVSASGLDENWLGRVIDKATLEELEALSKKYGFNMAFEGGEAETFVLDCPLFKKRIEISNARKHWDGYRGYYEILDAKIIDKQSSMNYSL